MSPEVLTQLWERQWPGCSKVPYTLRGLGDRWVRFHTLPGSKRYPDNDTEYEIILQRHNTVLDELVDDSRLIVVTAGYSSEPAPSGEVRSPETVAAHIGALYWASEVLDDEPGFESSIHLYVSEVPWSAGCVDALLRLVADDVIANVLLADPALRWLYHPYDGGMDVVLPSPDERDVLKHRHRNWLSSHPAGL